MKIKLIESFYNRLSLQVDYISKFSKTNAKRFKTGILQEIRNIPQNPYLYRKSIFYDDKNIRELIFKGYCIVFHINKKKN